MKGDRVKKIEVCEYTEGKKKKKDILQYTELYVNDVLRYRAGNW